MTDLSVAIIGAGIVGLQTAYQLAKRGETDIAVFEESPFPGEHSSSRNSGVLHAGIYYEKKSVKQRFCVEGNRLWGELADELGIYLKRTGKYIISTNRTENDELERIYQFVKEKNVPGVRWASKEEIETLGRYVYISNAFFSETTGILDVSEAIKKLTDSLYSMNIPVLLAQPIEYIKRTGNTYELEVGGDKITVDKVVNCAGHRAIELREKLGLDELENLFVKGRYLKLGKKFFTESLLYPIPQKNLKGLGVHTSFDREGVVRFGPDTKDVTLINYSLQEEVLDEVYPAIAKTFKGIERQDLSLDYSGVRSKIRFKGDKQQYPDFWIKESLPSYWECLGIESPGLTASPAIAAHLVSNIIS